MKPLPGEGGWYVETYRSDTPIPASALPERYKNTERQFGTAILYLITNDSFSKLHRVASDEIFHFYYGDPVEMIQLDNGIVKKFTLGSAIFSHQLCQVLVPKGVWQGAHIKPGGSFALLGCTVAPGFEFEDFETADRKKMIEQYPDIEDLIINLT